MFCVDSTLHVLSSGFVLIQPSTPCLSTYVYRYGVHPCGERMRGNQEHFVHTCCYGMQTSSSLELIASAFIAFEVVGYWGGQVDVYNR